ncbi:MAG TPA: phosphatase PAP2 family protein [Thermoanaerobaculia bacterium]
MKTLVTEGSTAGEQRRYPLAFLLCTALVIVSIAWIDRPVADYAFAHFRDTALARWISRGLGPLRLIVPLAILWLAGSGGWRLSARPVPSWARPPLVVSVSVGLAGLTTILLKYLFGRTSADPSYLVHGVHEWRPLRGDASHLAFPSGTMAVAGAALTVLCILQPRLRGASAVVLAALAAALIVTNSHWVADIIAGVFLGIGVGRTVLPLCRRLGFGPT